MPPKPKFTKEEIINAALELVRENGIEAVTSRHLGNKLGSSARPIFTVFQNMDEVKQEVREAALKVHAEFIKNSEEYVPALKRLGMQMISFAIKEPKLFQLIYMQEHTELKSFEETLLERDDVVTFKKSIEYLQKDYNLSLEKAKVLLNLLCLNTFGMCAMCVLKICTFTEDEILEVFGRNFGGLMMLIKSGNFDSCKIEVEKNIAGKTSTALEKLSYLKSLEK